MATSGTYSFGVTRDQIVRKALLDLKKIDGIDPIDSTILSDCVFNLNLLVKQWMGKADFAPGLKVWTRKQGHLFLHSTTGEYQLNSSYVGWATAYSQTYSTGALAAGATSIPVQDLDSIAVNDKVGIELDSGDLFWSTVASLGTLTINLSSSLPSSSNFGNIVFTYTSTPQTPLSIETATLRDANYNDTPMNIMQRRDYDFLPNKVSPTNLGDPTAILYETNSLTYGTLYTDIAGSNDVTKHLALTYMEPVQDITNPTDAPYFPQEWFLPLSWALAKQCAPMFNSAWSPVMESNYTDALAIARRKDPEIETRYFQCGD